MKSYIKYLILVVVVGIIGVGFYKKVYIPKHTFKIVTPSKGNIPFEISGIGNVGAENIYKIGALYGGKMYDFSLQAGDKVEKNQTIAKIDSVDLINQIKSQNALIAKLKEDIKALQSDKKSAEVNYQYQLDLFKKNAKLYKLHSISNLEYEKYKTQKDTAKLKISTLEANIKALNKQILQTEENIKGLQKRLKFYTIISPVSGYVTKKIAENHQILPPNSTIIEVVNPKDVWVQTYIDTRISGDVKIGDEAIIKLRSSNKRYKGKVVNINPVNNPITYEREIDVKFDNLPIPFYMSEQARVWIKIKNLKNIIKIPAKAIVFYQEKEGVWVVKNNKVFFKPIKILTRYKNEAGVRGLNIDDKIIIPNPKKAPLKNGMKIYND